MSTVGWIMVAGLGLAVGGLATAWRLTARRLALLERRLNALVTQVRSSLAPAVQDASRTAARASYEAHRAARAAGVAEQPPPLALERLTGPVVRTLAWGAGARRMLRRLASTQVASDRAIRCR